MLITRRKITPVAFFILLLLALVSCEATSPVAPTQTLTLPAATPSPTITPSPSDTPTPAAPRAILLAPAGSDQATSDSLEETLRSLAQTAGLEFEVSQALEDLQGVRVVVAIPPDTGLAEFASAAPEVHFLAVGIPGIEPAANMSVITPTTSTPDQMGFLAGYTAAMITEDWRTGVVSLEGDPDSSAASQGFDNGMTYFCGLCLAVYPPFPNSGYPIQVSLPAGAGPDAWQASLEALSTWQVETVFVYPAVASDELLTALAEAGMNLIVATAPQSAWRDHWVATINPGDPLNVVPDLWARILGGEGAARLRPGLGS